MMGSGRASEELREGHLEIVLQNPRRYRSLEREALEVWLRDLLGELAPRAVSFGVRFVSDGEMAELNRRYRHRQGTTDVLSFPGTGTAEGPHLGDVVVSVPCARRQAAERGASEQTELRSLLLHGVLHCLGFDHETDDGRMSRMEQRLRRRWVQDAD